MSSIWFFPGCALLRKLAGHPKRRATGPTSTSECNSTTGDWISSTSSVAAKPPNKRCIEVGGRRGASRRLRVEGKVREQTRTGRDVHSDSFVFNWHSQF